jgi:hypothetical protein
MNDINLRLTESDSLSAGLVQNDLNLCLGESDGLRVRLVQDDLNLRLTESDSLSICLDQNDGRHTLTLATPVAKGTGTGDYNDLINKPSIEGVELIGDLTWEDIGIPDCSMKALTIEELDIITRSSSSESSLIKLLELGGHIELNRDVVLSKNITVNTDTVLDLQNNYLSGGKLIADGVSLTIKNGQIQSGITSAENGGEVVIEDCIIVS